MQIFRWLLLVPTFGVGTLLGSVFLGMAPVMALGAFVHDFHYSLFARRWVEVAGMVGGISSIVVVSVLLWLERKKTLNEIL